MPMPQDKYLRVREQLALEGFIGSKAEHSSHIDTQAQVATSTTSITLSPLSDAKSLAPSMSPQQKAWATRRKNHPLWPKDLEIKRLYESGFSTYRIEQILGVSDTLIWQRLKKMGVRMRSHTEASKLCCGQADWLPQAIPMYNEGMLVAEIGRVLDKVPTAITVALRKAGIPMKTRTHSEVMTKIWQDTPLDEKRARLKNALSASKESPNGGEIDCGLLLEDNFPNQWIYTGDGSFFVGPRLLNPDFVHQEKPLIIELFGEPWHDGTFEIGELRYEEPRKLYYQQYGFRCLVIWDKELRHKDLLLKKIAQFMAENESKVEPKEPGSQ